MTVVELLTRARKRIERPECWTQGEFARDEYGESVSSTSEVAVCWCVYGALLAEAGGARELYVANELLCKVVGDPDDIAEDFNDSDDRTHAEVLAAFDRAIELAQSTPSKPTESIGREER